MLKLHSPSVSLLGLAALAFAAPAGAQSFAFNGSLPQGDAVASIDFTVSQFEQWLFYTTSYATGGFDPVLTLFERNGLFQADNDDAPFFAVPKPAPSDFDSFIEIQLEPGDYTLAVSQTGNFSSVGSTLSDPFSGAGTLAGFGGRTSAFAAVGVAVPEPGSAALLLAGAGAAVGLLRRRRK